MNKIKFNKLLTTDIIAPLSQIILNTKIDNIKIINNTCLVMELFPTKKMNLFISIDKNEPYIALIDKEKVMSSIDTGFSQQMRHHLRGGRIAKVSQINDDSIICINIAKINPNDLSLIDLKLYLELIPFKPNLIITNQEDKILFASHYSKIEDEREILVNKIYCLPKQENLAVEENNFTFDDVNKYAEKLFVKALKKRRKDKYENCFTLIKSKIKLLKKKIIALQQDHQDGENGLALQELGNACYYMEKADLLDMFKDAHQNYDETLTPALNAEKCFKNYKKSKRKMEISAEQLKISQENLAYYESLLFQFENGDEEDLNQVQFSLFPKAKMTPQERKIVNKLNPYYIDLNGTKILFGKNHNQNDHLTFDVAHKKETFLHIDGYAGAHVIIRSFNPSKEELLTAAELCLLLSGQEDGDVSYTLVKNIKKTGTPGLVKLEEFKTIHLKEVRNSTVKLLNNATKRL